MYLPPSVVLLSPGNLTPRECGDFRRQVAYLALSLQQLGVADAASGGRASGPSLGFCGLLLREPELDDRPYAELLEALASELPELCLGLHDRLHVLALWRQRSGAARVPWLHLAGHSLPAVHARRLLGPTACLGFSWHAGQPLEQAAALDYVFLSPVHAVPGKGSPLGLDGFGQACRGQALPAWALGGLGADDVAGVLAAGARGVVFQRAWLQALNAGILVDFLRACRSRLAPATGAGGSGAPSHAG
jgi:thiamine monophosphate synthase